MHPSGALTGPAARPGDQCVPQGYISSPQARRPPNPWIPGYTPDPEGPKSGGVRNRGGPDVGGRGKRGIPIYILARARRPRRGKMTPFWGHSRTGSERVLTALGQDVLFSGIKWPSTVKSVY